jgi:hypothetical protein
VDVNILPDTPDGLREFYDQQERAAMEQFFVEGERFAQWEREGWSEAELSRRIGRPRAYIQQRKALYHAAPTVKAAFFEGKILLIHARQIAQVARGSYASQERALELLLVRLQSGQDVNEREAEAITRHAISGGWGE